MSEQTADSAAVPPPPPPPLPHRRPRVREVSSRFMSPLVQSNSTPALSDLRRSKSVTVQRKQQQQRGKYHNKENGDTKEHQPGARVSSRPDTPIAIGTDRIVPSRYRQVPSSISRSNSLNSSSSGCSAVTAAARLLQEATSDVEKKLPRTSTSSVDDSDACSTTSNQGSTSCPNSPICVPVSKPRCATTDVRSSMPNVEKWLADRNFEAAGKVDCARSLNFSSSLKIGGGLSRPPHPSSCVRAGLELRKGKKGQPNHQEDVHSFKMLSNHFLQWRFANAKAEASMNVQKQEAERKLFSLGGKLSDLRENVKKKRKELAAWRGLKTLTTIVDAQMPYLDEWSAVEEDYASSMSGMTNALLSSSVRVPVSGEVRADAAQIGEALNSAIKVVELIGSQVQRFFPKAEEMDLSISELARMTGGEKALIEECGDLLSRTYSSQVNECSLRGALMQWNHATLINPRSN